MEMWNSKRFPEHTMTKWTEKPPARKVWAQSVPYFEKKIAALEKYELTNGEAEPN